MEANNMLLSNEWVNNKIKGEIKWYLETNEMRTQQPKSMRHSKSSPKREIHSITDLSQEQEKSQINNVTLHVKELEKEKQTKPTVNRRREIIKRRAEINETE